jgi:hypothetical protein
MSQSYVGTDLHVAGTLTAQSITLPALAVNNAAVAVGSAGNYLSASKLEHRHMPCYSQEAATDAAADNKVVHVCRGAGTLTRFAAGSVVAATGTGTATVDLRKNGTTVLSAPVVLDSANAAYTPETTVSFTSTALAAGDVLSIVVSAVSGTAKAKGLYAQVELSEEPS